MKNVLFLAAGITTSARPKREMMQRDGWNLFWRFALTSPLSVFLRTAVDAELSVHQKPPKIRFSQDPGSNWFIIFCSVQAWRALPMFGKSTKLSQRTKQGRFMVFRFGCWLKEHEANRLPGYAEAQICVSQGVQECPCWISRDVWRNNQWTCSKIPSHPPLSVINLNTKNWKKEECSRIKAATAVKESSQIWRHYT